MSKDLEARLLFLEEEIQIATNTIGGCALRELKNSLTDAADQLECYRVALEGVFAAVGKMTAPEGHPIHKAFETARQALEAK